MSLLLPNNLEVIKPLAPSGDGWICRGAIPMDGYHAYAYCHQASGLSVISGLEVPDTKIGPEYHVSVSANGERCSSEQAAWALSCFAMDGAEEDNHVPFGKVRNYWKPVAERLIGDECPCKEKEQAIVEDKGDYVWREDLS